MPLHAVYTAPEESRAFDLPITASLPVSSDAFPENNDINVFLTAKMEEDKKAAEAEGRKVSEKEAKEEENYGEEVVEEDA
ncbi:hypothetical protein BDV59DRAFT_202574 [Aspergillus ambiguus]|uniref:uncharacterized protein n=1 Tax=Aspergillus ambiguus TaxID=176160 RepID=UPI003CCDFB32